MRIEKDGPFSSFPSSHLSLNLLQVLLDRAERHPDRPALIEGCPPRARIMTFQELAEATEKAAAVWQASGLSPGQVVLMLHPPSIDLYVALLGLWRAGLTAMFLDPSAGRKFLNQCAEIGQPAAFYGSPQAQLWRLLHGPLRKLPAFCPQGKWWGSEKFGALAPEKPVIPGNDAASPLPGKPAGPAPMAMAEVGEDAPALITFTSGSTGQPKAIVRSHGFLIRQHRALQSSLAHREGEVDLITLPIFTLANLASGLVSILADSPAARPASVRAPQVAAQIKAWKVTRTACSPAFLESLFQQKPEALASLRHVYTGGAPVFPRLLERVESAHPHLQLHIVYGSTEAEPIAHQTWGDISRAERASIQQGKGLLVGEVVPGLELALLRPPWGEPRPAMSAVDFQSLKSNAFEAGEIVVSGPQVITGYLHGRGDAETKIRVGEQIWHRTGDAGQLDSCGRLWLLGRCRAALPPITADDPWIFPFAVEVLLHQFPEIARAALATTKEGPVAAVEVLDGYIAQAEERQQWQKALAATGVTSVMTLRKIPVDKRHQAKVDYTRLEKMMHWQELWQRWTRWVRRAPLAPPSAPPREN